MAGFIMGRTMSDDRIALLQQMAVFGAIRDDVLEFLLGLSRTVKLRAGEYFFHQGEPGEAMYVLESGAVEVLKSRATEPPRLLKRLVAGDCFGEMALMDLAPRSADVRAAEDCVAIEISTAVLMRVYEKDIQQFVLIEMNMGRELCRRLREADERAFLSRW
jgi:CRP-like cAMP-binding protein